MSRLTISLFGRFSAVRSEKEVEGLEAQKVQELLCYLLIHRDRPHGREKLADLLWPTSSCTQSKQYLRQTLCQLQAALATNEVADNALIVVESDWIQINTDAAYTLDLCQFEQAFALSQRQQGHELDAAQARQLEAAVQLYCGDLLENWYQVHGR
jgi:DNA-binding SARP family transcriptional activator